MPDTWGGHTRPRQYPVERSLRALRAHKLPIPLQAAISYSRISPPSTSCVRTRSPSAGHRAGPGRGSGVLSPRPRCGLRRCSARRRPEARAPGGGGRARASSPDTPSGPCGPTARRTHSRASPDRRLDNPHAFGAEDLVGRAGELRVPIPDEEPNASSRSGTDMLRACWVTHVELGFRVTPRTSTRRKPRWIANRTYSVRSQTASTVKKSRASIPCACERRNSRQVGPSRRGAGPSPFARSSVRILVAETLMPSLASSPRILMQPHRGFSRPIRRMSCRTASGIAGLPPAELRRKVHFRRTSSRCHRRSVFGLIRNEDHRARGRTLLIAAIKNPGRDGEDAACPPGA